MFNLLCTIAAVGLTSWLIITSSLICISKYAVGLSVVAGLPSLSTLTKRLVVKPISLTGVPVLNGSSAILIISWNGPLIYFDCADVAPAPLALTYMSGAAALSAVTVPPVPKLYSARVAMSGPLVK